MAKLADTSDMSLTDAANYIQSHAQGYRAVLAIADRISDVTKIDAQLAETERTLASKRSELDALNTQIDDAHAKLEDANGSIDDAKQTAVEIIAKANADGRGIIAKAEGDAKSAADVVAQKASGNLAVLQGKVDAAQVDLDTVNADMASAKDTLAGLLAEADAAEARAKAARDYIAGLKG